MNAYQMVQLMNLKMNVETHTTPHKFPKKIIVQKRFLVRQLIVELLSLFQLR